MIINESKCNVIHFNFSKYNYPPQNLNLNDKLLQPVDKIKLLGVILTNDLKWTENTSNICSKVNQKLYLISKLKHFGLLKEELITAWQSILRPITEYAVPLWHSGLTEHDNNRLEMLQKKVLGIILGTIYIENRRYYKLEETHMSYDEALQTIGLTTLKYRREVLTNKFALETVRNEKHIDMFLKKQSINIVTRNATLLDEYSCKTERHFKSAIPYMSRILNCVYL